MRRATAEFGNAHSWPTRKPLEACVPLEGPVIEPAWRTNANLTEKFVGLIVVRADMRRLGGSGARGRPGRGIHAGRSSFTLAAQTRTHQPQVSERARKSASHLRVQKPPLHFRQTLRWRASAHFGQDMRSHLLPQRGDDRAWRLMCRNARRLRNRSGMNVGTKRRFPLPLGTLPAFRARSDRDMAGFA